MRSLNPDQLRTLLAVAELGSFSAAARRLNLTQPAVSVQIRELESRLGVGLIERLGKKAYATAAGQDLLEHVRRLVHEEETALATMRRHREGLIGRIRLGTNAHYLIYGLPPVLQKLRTQFPLIELVITTGTTGNLIERMQRNEIDICLVTLPVDERLFATTELRRDPILAALPASYATVPDRVTPAYADGHPLIIEYRHSAVGLLIAAWLEAGGVAMRPAMELDNVEAMITAVAAGLGISFIDHLPGFRARPACDDGVCADGIVLRPLDPPLERPIGIAVRRDKPDEPALSIVRQALLALSEPAPVHRETRLNSVPGEPLLLDRGNGDSRSDKSRRRDRATRAACCGGSSQASPDARQPTPPEIFPISGG